MDDLECESHIGQSYIIQDFRTGDMICTGCGRVLERLVNDECEWRYFENDTKSRVVSDNIDNNNFKNIDFIKTDYGDVKNYKMKNKYIVSSFRENESLIKDICFKNNIGDSTRNICIDLFKKLKEEAPKLKFKSNSHIIAACLYIAHRLDNKFVTFKKISSFFSSLTLKNKCNRLEKIVSIILNSLKIQLPDIEIDSYLEGCLNKIYSNRYSIKKSDILKSVKEHYVCLLKNNYLRNKNINSLVALSLYISFNKLKLPIDISELSNICLVSEKTTKLIINNINLLEHFD